MYAFSYPVNLINQPPHSIRERKLTSKMDTPPERWEMHIGSAKRGAERGFYF
jgi:hypothetical protein